MIRAVNGVNHPHGDHPVSIKKVFLFSLVLAGGLFIHPSFAATPLMVEKNLFAQDRKPPPPESAASSTQPGRPGMPVNNIQLDGVILLGNSKKALVRLKNQPAGPDKKKQQSPFVTVRENQQIGEFRVVKIDAKSISLEKDGQTFLISLFAEGKVVVPAAAIPSPAAAPPGPGGVPGQNQPGGAHAPGMRGRNVQPGQVMPGQTLPGAAQPAVVDPSAMQQGLPEPDAGEAEGDANIDEGAIDDEG